MCLCTVVLGLRSFFREKMQLILVIGKKLFKQLKLWLTADCEYPINVQRYLFADGLKSVHLA